MEYEGSIGFVTGKMKKNIADFHVLVLFMTKNMIFVCHAPLPPFTKICTTPTASPLQARKLKS
jgi:hypothetical protein